MRAGLVRGVRRAAASVLFPSVLALALGWNARPREVHAAPPPGPPVGCAKEPEEIEVLVVRERRGTRYRLDEETFTVRAPPDELVVSRRLSPSERERLRAAVDRALADLHTTSSCGRGETFVSVTHAHRLRWNAWCPTVPAPRPDDGRWRDVVALVEALAAGPLVDHPADGGAR